MNSAHEVAKYFLWLADAEDDDLVSNMKLQKLLYYAQGFHLAILDEPLFPEAIERWVHGPVVPEIYHAYKSYGKDGIAYGGDLDPNDFDLQTREVLEEVYKVYGHFTASWLRQLTHDEPPWRDTEERSIISRDSLKQFFRTRVVDDEKAAAT
ncbi:MAG: DUF4065 domain-containing protein [Chloroflexota bacterium]|nr:DUF4065 domain-containing protein [Chloroflexota bacterium]